MVFYLIKNYFIKHSIKCLKVVLNLSVLFSYIKWYHLAFNKNLLHICNITFIMSSCLIFMRNSGSCKENIYRVSDRCSWGTLKLIVLYGSLLRELLVPGTDRQQHGRGSEEKKLWPPLLQWAPLHLSEDRNDFTAQACSQALWFPCRSQGRD